MAKIQLLIDGEDFPLNAGASTFALGVTFNWEVNALPDNACRCRLYLNADSTADIQNISIVFPIEFNAGDTIFCNGYQSWSESREYRLEERLPRLRSWIRPLLGPMGDDNFDEVKRGRNWKHSWSYTYIRRTGAAGLLLLGSLNESTGFTCFQCNTSEGLVAVTKEIPAQYSAGNRVVIDLFVSTGAPVAVFNGWFELLNIRPRIQGRATGWTSWYNHYVNISEHIILDNLAAFQRKGAKLDFFQVDDGFQRHVGDWLDIKPAFPRGMAPVAAAIKTAGYRPGLWLAPFVAARKSAICRQHPDWLLRDRRGRPVKAGFNPLWGGTFYALDLYHPAFREYLREVFNTVVQTWGFELLKLDFLYAACLAPPAGKTRGQVMWEAMAFLRELAGDALLLGCGVPLASAFGWVDYCRIGADIHLRWEHRLLAWLRLRERVSTLLALRNTLGRWALHQRAFLNDPDVFLLRKDRIVLNAVQQNTILQINNLLGGVLFTSDNPDRYNEQQWRDFQCIFDTTSQHITDVYCVQPDVYVIEGVNASRIFFVFANLNPREAEFTYGGKKWNIPAFCTCRPL